MNPQFWGYYLVVCLVIAAFHTIFLWCYYLVIAQVVDQRPIVWRGVTYTDRRQLFWYFFRLAVGNWLLFFLAPLFVLQALYCAYRIGQLCADVSLNRVREPEESGPFFVPDEHARVTPRPLSQFAVDEQNVGVDDTE